MPTDLPPDYKPQPAPDDKKLPGDGKAPPGVVQPAEGEDAKDPGPIAPNPGVDVPAIPAPAGKPTFRA